MKTVKTKRTKKYLASKRIFWTLSFLCNFGLLIAFFIYGMANATETVRYTMTMTGLVGIIVSGISAICKKHWRTPLVIILGGLYLVADKFLIVLAIIGIAIMLDELIFRPAYLHFREKASINLEIDKRG